MQTISVHEREIYEERRRARAESLQAEISYISLAGLDWLHAGDNTFGTGGQNDIVLPAGSAPEVAGVFQLDGDAVTLTVAPGVVMTTADGAPIHTMPVQTDATGAPDYLYLGNLAMLVLLRGARYALRLYDTQHPERLNFPGLRWYDVDPDFRLDAEFIPYDPPRPLPIVDATGYVFEVASPGYAQFVWQGKTYRLDAQDRDAHYFFNFADATNGDTTYGAGRFLYAPLPAAGRIELDFNQATNPYCAYTPYATCPLPPRANRLDFRVEAGEMDYVRAT